MIIHDQAGGLLINVRAKTVRRIPGNKERRPEMCHGIRCFDEHTEEEAWHGAE
jgi:hypothetical protein